MGMPCSGKSSGPRGTDALESSRSDFPMGEATCAGLQMGFWLMTLPWRISWEKILVEKKLNDEKWEGAERGGVERLPQCPTKKRVRHPSLHEPPPPEILATKGRADVLRVL